MYNILTALPWSVSSVQGVVIVGTVFASDGVLISPDSLAKTFTLDASGNVLTASVTASNGNTYVQTYTRNGSGNVTAISQWVKQ